jgi:hypothetical protein
LATAPSLTAGLHLLSPAFLRIELALLNKELNQVFQTWTEATSADWDV